MSTIRALAGAGLAVMVGGLVSWAGSDGGVRVGGVPVFALCGALAFAVNWAAFVPASLARTERFYDLTGSLTYLTVVGAAILLSGEPGPRSLLVAGLVAVWTLRLGTFLFRRVLREGKDRRFDQIKTDPARFFLAWTLQGLWVLLTVSPALAVITGPEQGGLDLAAVVGAALWAVGFGIEVVADRQKAVFRRENPDGFISSGLWAWSRHPNYLGEILLWVGVTVIALPTLSGWRWMTVISPLFVTFLITRVSGIPMLEARADARWGDRPDYVRYKETTPVLVPRPPRRR